MAIRSTNFDVMIQDKDLRQKILNSIRMYRAVSRKIFTACAMAEMAGAKIEFGDDLKIKSDSEAAKIILANAFGKDGKAHLYQCRDMVLKELAPTWNSFVWDSLRDSVSSRWRAPDPEHGVRRGFLVLNGARNIAFFNHIGIGFPAATACPKMNGRQLSLKWDKDIGVVDFTFPRLDGGRYKVWRCLRDKEEGWKLGTMYLTERDGRLRVTVSYHMPDKKEDLDAGKVLNIEFTEDPDNYITMSSEVETLRANRISIRETLGWLSHLSILRDKYESQKSSLGSMQRRWVKPSIMEAVTRKLNNVTLTRTNGQQTRNHLWTRNIVDHASKLGCGLIRITKLPEKEVLGHSWAWSQFKQFLTYKTEEAGAKVEYIK